MTKKSILKMSTKNFGCSKNFKNVAENLLSKPRYKIPFFFVALPDLFQGLWSVNLHLLFENLNRGATSASLKSYLKMIPEMLGGYYHLVQLCHQKLQVRGIPIIEESKTGISAHWSPVFAIIQWSLHSHVPAQCSTEFPEHPRKILTESSAILLLLN